MPSLDEIIVKNKDGKLEISLGKIPQGIFQLEAEKNNMTVEEYLKFILSKINND